MFYNSLKKQTLAEYDAAIKEFQTTCDQVQQAIAAYNDTRQKAVDLINCCSVIINTITNTPRDFNASLQEVAVNIASFKLVEEFHAQAFDGYLDAAGEMIKGAGAAWFPLRSTDRVDKLWGWIVIAIRSTTSGIKLSGTNARIAREAKSMTKKVKAENIRVKKIIVDIGALSTRTHSLHDELSKQMEDISGYQGVNYIELNSDQRFFLGHYVNSILSLSRLLNNTEFFERTEL